MIGPSYCRARGCFGTVRRLGLCSTHLGWATGQEKPVRTVPASERTCSLEKCTELAAYGTVGKYRCEVHFRPGRRPRAEPKPPTPCAVETCEDRSYSRGWCPGHYWAWKKRGDPLSVCAVDNCMRSPQYEGMCSQHGVVPAKSPCSVEGCELVGSVRGMCGKHYNQDYRIRKASEREQCAGGQLSLRNPA